MDARVRPPGGALDPSERPAGRAGACTASAGRLALAPSRQRGFLSKGRLYGSVDQAGGVGPPRGRSTATSPAALLALLATGPIQGGA
jgi:hypothetical protein